MCKERIAKICPCCEGDNLKRSPAVLMPFVADRALGYKPVFIDSTWGLNTIKQGMAYTICSTLFCVSCEFVFLDIRFSETEMNKLYNDYRGESYSILRESYEPGYSKKNDVLNNGINYIDKIEDFLKPFVKSPTKVLDWGGDTGKNTPFKYESRTIHIYDISTKPAIDGVEFVDKEVAFNTLYDVIICSNVLEHVPFPEELILDIKKAMNINTVLYIEVPLEEIIRTSSNLSLDFIRKKHWHEHVNFFSESSLIKLLTRLGLVVLDLKIERREFGEASSSYMFQVASRLF